MLSQMTRPGDNPHDKQDATQMIKPDDNLDDYPDENPKDITR
jgi:hypothetical protein